MAVLFVNSSIISLIYNQDIGKNSILIEVGGVDNTIEEVYNTLEVLSDILVTFVKGE